MFAGVQVSKGVTLQHTATYYNTLLQHTAATHGNKLLQHTAAHCCNTPQHTTATHGSTLLQHMATHCVCLRQGIEGRHVFEILLLVVLAHL